MNYQYLLRCLIYAKRVLSLRQLHCAVLAGFVFLALSGCNSIQVALGLKMRLADVPVTAISTYLSPGPGLAPGKSAGLVIVTKTPDGKSLVTEGLGKGKVLFESFSFDPKIVQISKDGIVSLPADPRLSEGQLPQIHITTVGHEYVVTDLAIPVRYDASFDVDFSGGAGANGFSGINGQDGTDGSMGSSDINNPSAGGNGTNGSDGRDGDNGGAGAPGEAVHVWLRLKQGAHSLLQARVAGASREHFFLIDSDQGSLSVSTNGGAGGSSGSGGRGGRGGFGGVGSPSGSNGLDGRNGSDGMPGPAGAGGTILVSIDPLAKSFLHRLHFSNKSGDGKAGPKPDVRIESVPAIW
jgi:hypothetical protein